MIATPAVIPELDVSDLVRSREVYVRVLGFHVHVERPEDRFIYLIREEAHLMLEEAAGPGRRFRSAALERPFGRGLNLQIKVADVESLYRAVQSSTLKIQARLEERWYRHDAEALGVRQFVVADPDGYLLRFATVLGAQPAG